MHTQHVKFSAYVAWGGGVGVAVAVGVVFEEGEAGLDDDDGGSVFEVVVVVACCLPSPPFFFFFFFLVLLDSIVEGRWGLPGLVCCDVLFRCSY